MTRRPHHFRRMILLKSGPKPRINGTYLHHIASHKRREPLPSNKSENGCHSLKPINVIRKSVPFRTVSLMKSLVPFALPLPGQFR
jgi:hypothetical protein